MTLPSTPPETTISTRLLTRVVILLIAAWTLVCGAVLVALEGPSAGALGAGVDDRSGQRLLGVHLLVLVPVYVLLAWRTEQYRGLLWLPYATQLAVVLGVGYSMLQGDAEFGEGILAVAVGAIFVGLLSVLWIAEQRAASSEEAAAEESLDASGEQPPSDQG